MPTGSRTSCDPPSRRQCGSSDLGDGMLSAPKPCTWENLTYLHGYFKRNSWSCSEHNAISHTDEPPEFCVKSKCLPCQAQRECKRHDTRYERYQQNTAVWLAGALADAEEKLDQLRAIVAIGELDKIPNLLTPGAHRDDAADAELFAKISKL